MDIIHQNRTGEHRTMFELLLCLWDQWSRRPAGVGNSWDLCSNGDVSQDGDTPKSSILLGCSNYWYFFLTIHFGVPPLAGNLWYSMSSARGYQPGFLLRAPCTSCPPHGDAWQYPMWISKSSCHIMSIINTLAMFTFLANSLLYIIIQCCG